MATKQLYEEVFKEVEKEHVSKIIQFGSVCVLCETTFPCKYIEMVLSFREHRNKLEELLLVTRRRVAGIQMKVENWTKLQAEVELLLKGKL